MAQSTPAPQPPTQDTAETTQVLRRRRSSGWRTGHQLGTNPFLFPPKMVSTEIKSTVFARRNNGAMSCVKFSHTHSPGSRVPWPHWAAPAPGTVAFVESLGLETSERSPAKSWPPCPWHGQLLTIQRAAFRKDPEPGRKRGKHRAGAPWGPGGSRLHRSGLRQGGQSRERGGASSRQ